MSAVHLSRAARRWQEIVNDPELSQRPERIEIDAGGQVTMAPPPDFIDRSQAKEIQAQLDRLFGQARAFTEQPIETAIGTVKMVGKHSGASAANDGLPAAGAVEIDCFARIPDSDRREMRAIVIYGRIRSC